MRYYSNPVSDTTKPDPFILQVEGVYYCYSTHTDGIKVSMSDDLIHFEDRGFAYQKEDERDFWAPATIYLNGIYYMYFSSVDKIKTDTLEEKLKVASSRNPLGPFRFEKQLFNFFSIDAQPYFHRGSLYLFYSTNVLGCDDDMPGTSIVVDKMINPLEVEGLPKIVVKPTLKDEVFQINRFDDNRDWYTIEGASIIERNNKLYILYSANSYLNENYFINYSVGDLKEDLRDIDFKKYPDDYTYHALLKKNNLVGGTGHNSVCKGPNLITDFIIYHGRNNDIAFDIDKEQRTMRVDRLFFNGDKLYCDGPSLNKIEMPDSPLKCEKDIVLSNSSKKIDIEGNYILDLWIKGIPSHSGIRFGVLIGERLDIELIQGIPYISIYRVNGNIRSKIQEIKISSDFDFEVSHCFKIKKIFDTVYLELEDNRKFKIELNLLDNLEIYSLFGKSQIISYTLNWYDNLENETLIYLDNFFEVSKRIEIIDNHISLINNTSMRAKCIGIHSLTVIPLSKDSCIYVNDKKYDILEICNIEFNKRKNEEILLTFDKVQITKLEYKKLQ
ncbi:MAG: glycoside hydrolase family 43 protein [Sphaerochaeta sp.]